MRAAKSSCYVQTKKLAEDGYLSATVLDQDRPRPLTLYRLTDKGQHAVERWLHTPAKAPPIDSEAFLRARAASFVAPQVILHGLRHLRPDLTRLLAAADAREAEFASRQPPLSDQLQLDLVRSVLQTYLRWLTRTEKALAREIRFTEDNR
jgi:DNA-binding PadR family transcriptional regulator